MSSDGEDHQFYHHHPHCTAEHLREAARACGRTHPQDEGGDGQDRCEEEMRALLGSPSQGLGSWLVAAEIALLDEDKVQLETPERQLEHMVS